MSDVLITGAGRGIGLGLASAYLDAGARVFAACRNPGGAEGLRDRYHQRLVLVDIDVTQPNRVAAAADAVAWHTDGLDVLVNNAGVYHRSDSLATATLEALTESLRVNAVGPLLVARAFHRLLAARPNARLVNITMPTRPVGALTATTDHAYVASRYALNALTRMIAAELAPAITTIALYPGYLRTDMNHHDADARPVEEAAPELVALLESIGPADNGACLLPDRSRYDW